MSVQHGLTWALAIALLGVATGRARADEDDDERAASEAEELDGSAAHDAFEEEWSEGFDDLEALDVLEAEMLDDLRLQLPDPEDVLGPYEGMEPLSAGPHLRTVVEVPRAERFSTSASATAREAEPLTLDTGSEPREDIVRPAIEHVDLSGLRPLFGLETLDHGPIHSYLEFYTGPGRRRLARLLARSGRYADLIRGELRAAGLPEELLYLVMIESAFEACPRSHAGAVGLWQFMPRTGRGYGLEVERRYDERCDPEASTRAAIAYLSSLYERFGSWPLAMAGYNAGGGHVVGELRRYNLNDFWRMDDYSAVYDDTRRYVYKIIAAAVIGENPEMFGFEGIVRDDALAWETVEVPGRTRLNVFARAAETDVETLMELNPALRVSSTPDVEVYRLHLPPGSLEDFVANYDDYVPAEAGRTYLHTMRVGDTLESMAELFGVSERVLRAANGLERGAEPRYGAELVIPVEPEDAAACLAREPGPAPDASARPIVVTPPLRFFYPGRERVFYAAHSADELPVVAEAFHVSVWDLAMWNDLDPDAALHDEMMLQVFLEPDADLTSVRYLPEEHVQALALGSEEYQAWDESQERERRTRRRTYTVRRGDTISGIARRFGVSSRDVMRWNGIENANRLRAGQDLRIR